MFPASVSLKLFSFSRGKKRKGLAAFKDTSSEDGYLIEEDGKKAWRPPAAAMAPAVARVKSPEDEEDEVQEVSIEMTEDVKPLGTMLLIIFIRFPQSTEVISSSYFLFCSSRYRETGKQ